MLRGGANRPREISRAMPGLTAQQTTVIRTLIDTAPDSAIRSLDAALASEPLEGAMAEIRDLVAFEAAERKTRTLVFQPLAALCPRKAPVSPHKTFPYKTLVLLWSALRSYAPDQASLAQAACLNWTDESDPPEVFDRLCADAAQGLRHAAGTPFAPAAALLDASEPQGAEIFASYLDLIPLARKTIRKLPEWLARMTDERAVTVRLAFKDATAIAADAGPKFFEILSAQLAEPWQILRIVSAVMDHPGDSYMAGSELKHIGERLLSEIGRHLDTLRAFDPFAGQAAGKAAALAVSSAVALIGEFENAVDLGKDGPWGSTIFKHKKDLAQTVEKAMGKADDALSAALPLRSARFGKGRGLPRYDNPPDSRAVMRAEAMMVFVNESRGAAPGGGYASFRGKVIEKLDDRIDHYIEDTLEHLRDEENTDHERAAEFLEIAAKLVGLLRDDKAAQIVRRRMAA
jgi:hypothetical protein